MKIIIRILASCVLLIFSSAISAGTVTDFDNEQVIKTAPLSPTSTLSMVSDSSDFFVKQPAHSAEDYTNPILPAVPPESARIEPQVNPHSDLWVLLFGAAILGLLSEIIQRR